MIKYKSEKKQKMSPAAVGAKAVAALAVLYDDEDEETPKERPDRALRRIIEDYRSGEDKRDALRAKLRINKRALDDEILEHVHLFDEVAVALQVAISDRDAFKEEARVAEARLTGEARAARLERGNTKPTVSDVDAWVLEQESAIRARRRHRDAESEVAQWAVLKESIIQRGYALKHFAELETARIYTSGQGSSFRPRPIRERD